MSAERATIARHAGTVLVGQWAVMAFGLTDTWVAARYDDAALAALSVGSAAYITIQVSLMGVVQALLPLWAELHGAGRPRALGRSVRQALYVCLLTIALGLLALLNPDPLLAWTGVPENLQAMVRDYLAILALSLPAALLFRWFGTINQALGRPKLVTWVQVLALGVKVPLSIVLALGAPQWGIAPMGLIGCAWASVAVQYVMLALSLALLRYADLYTPLALWRRLEAPHWRTQARFLRLGVAGGLTIAVEVTSFTLVALLVARLGVTATAAHQIMANAAALLYMVPLSLSIATSARVSYWLGAQHPARAQNALREGLGLLVVLALLFGVAIWLFNDALAAFYTPSPAVQAMAATLLQWLLAYHLVDASQALFVFVLRCYGVTLLPLLTYTLCLWGLGLGLGHALAIGYWDGSALGFTVGSPLAYWQASTLALLITDGIVGALLWQALRRANARPAATS